MYWEAGSDRADRSSDVSFVGDTRQSFSAKYVDSILHTRHLIRIVSHRNIVTYIASHLLLGSSHVRERDKMLLREVLSDSVNAKDRKSAAGSAMPLVVMGTSSGSVHVWHHRGKSRVFP